MCAQKSKSPGPQKFKSPGRAKLKPNPHFFQTVVTDESPISDAILKQARKSGQLNLSNRGLSNVPDKVWRLNIDPPEGSGIGFDNEERWWDQVELTRLNLSTNEIQELSADIQNFSCLQSLDVQYNKLTSLPASIGMLENLTKLLLSHNLLCTLPDEVCNLVNLQVLRLDNNHLSSLPDSIVQLKSLEELNLSDNRLERLPDNIGTLRLNVLHINGNRLTELPVSLGSMTGLKELCLNDNKLTSLPPFERLEKLVEINLRHNELREFPLIKEGTPLKALLLGANQISVLPEDRLRHVTSLTILELRENKINKIPDCIVELIYLERLDLTNNDISSLPFIMGSMETLQSLQLDGNPLRSLRRDIVSRGTAELLKYLSSRIENDPPEDTPTLNSPSHQTKMKFSPFRELEGKSPVVGGRNELDLSRNKLTELPKNAFDDTGISNLNLGFNKLSSLPDTVAIFHQLTALDIRNNLLSDLPSSLSSCKLLRDVNVSFNHFKVLPVILYSMSSMENIIASDNQINSIDVSGLMKLKNLSCLDFHNNDIQQVPPQLGNIEWLRHLDIGGNPFRNPRAAILSKGTADLLAYLRDRIPT